MMIKRGFQLLICLIICTSLMTNSQYAFDETEPAGKAMAEVTSLKVTPTKLATNRINMLKVTFRFNNPGNNIFGGRVIILYDFFPYTGKMKGIGNLPAESKVFKKSKGKFTTYISVLAENWETCDVTVVIEDKFGRRTEPSEPVTLTHEEIPQGETQGVKVGDYAYDFELYDHNGKMVRLSDYRGKVVLLDFCSWWCGICQTEARDLETLYQNYKDDGLVVLTAIESDENGMRATTQDCKRWARTFGFSTPVLRDTPRSVYYIYYWGSRVYFNEWVSALPYNFIIDREGKIFWKKRGISPGNWRGRSRRR